MNGQRGEVRAAAADYYEVLGVRRGADLAAIKLAYRRLARHHHPDVSEDKAAAEQKLRDINEAYSVLSDPQKRATYDRFGHTGVTGTGAESIARVFDMFFGATRGGAGQSPGKDMRIDARVTLDELVNGTTRELSFLRRVACEVCQGSGAEAGTSVSPCDRCFGTGTMRQVQQTPRSVHLTQTSCSLCNGTGQIIAAPCRVCGGRGAFESEDAVVVTIPAGSAEGTVIRVDGRGESGLDGDPAGDLYVRALLTDETIPRRPQHQTDVRRTTAEKQAAFVHPRQSAGTILPSPFRWSWVAAIALFALISSVVVLYAIQRGAPSKGSAGGDLGVCATASVQRLATDLVLGYMSQTAKAPDQPLVIRANGIDCNIQFSYAPANPEAAVARDAIVAIVNPLNAISRISEPQLRAVYSGSARDWSQLGGSRGVIVPFQPDAASDETRAIGATLFAGLPIERGVIRLPSSANVTRAVTGADRASRGAIGLVLFSKVVPAKMIPLAYLPAPNVLTIASRSYPLTLTISLQSESQRDSSAARNLLDFAHSRDGLAIVEKNGLVPPEGL